MRVSDLSADVCSSDLAIAFLEEMLKDGPVSSKQLDADAKGADHTAATIRRAKKQLGVLAYRQGEGIGGKSSWICKLPEIGDSPNMLTNSLRCSHPESEHLSDNVSILGKETLLVEEEICDRKSTRLNSSH